MFRKYGGSLRYTNGLVSAFATQGVCLIRGILNEVFTVKILSLDVQ